MSVDYAAGLSYYDDLGVCNLEEVFDTFDEVDAKVAKLADWLRKAKNSCVCHVGAGLSTSAGIRDFRGKGGVWSELLAKIRREKGADQAAAAAAAAQGSEPPDLPTFAQEVLPRSSEEPTVQAPIEEPDRLHTPHIDLSDTPTAFEQMPRSTLDVDLRVSSSPEEPAAPSTSWQQEPMPSTSSAQPARLNMTLLESEMAGRSDGGPIMTTFDQTKPTPGHMALKVLCEKGFIKHIISQNVDGLFLKANLGRKYISELHGNFYLDECTKCRYRFIRSTSSETMRLQRSNVRCKRNKIEYSESGRELEPSICKGFLRDTILDWEHPIPDHELRVAEREAKSAKIHIVIGTSLQLKPSKDLIFKRTKRTRKKLVIINLQPTHLDKRADLIINHYSDRVLTRLLRQLELEPEKYDELKDPTKRSDLVGSVYKK